MNNFYQYGLGLQDIGSLHKSKKIYQRGYGASGGGGGVTSVQSGHGLGSFFQSMYNSFSPLLLSGFNALRKEAGAVGRNIIRDIGQKPLTSLIEEHGGAAVDRMKDKITNKYKEMSGGRIKRKKPVVRKTTTKKLKIAKKPKKPIQKKPKKPTIKKGRKIERHQLFPDLTGRRTLKKTSQKKKPAPRDIFNE